MRKIFLIILTLLLLCSCNETNSLIANEEINNQQQPTSNELDQQITLKYENGDFTFNAKELPDIYNYLKNSEDLQLEVDRMKLDFIKNINQTNYYILKYSCGTKLCNNLLVREHNKKLDSILLSESSIFQEIFISPKSNYIAFLFVVNEGAVIRNDLIVVDTSSLQKKSINTSNGEKLKPFFWPIKDVEWVDDNRLKIDIPDISNFDFNSLEEWQLSSSKKSKSVNITVN